MKTHILSNMKIQKLWFKKIKVWGTEVAQWVNVLVMKFVELSLIPRTKPHKAGRKES